ncbi:MAG: helix-turn-helix domain-containing protein [Candidatus Diapherotrites archaeon]|nr:helix-turn-helix domain-containing protein [Candidatus Diapherotrites archaeon]
MDKLCPITKTLNHFGKKWSLHILRELNEKSKNRFTELLTNMKPISPRTLSKRLKEMEKQGFVQRKEFKEIPPRVEYTLTQKGKELIKCFKYMNTWVEKFDIQ